MKWPSKGFFIVLAIGVFSLIAIELRTTLPLGGPFGHWDAKRDIERGHLAMKVGMVDFGWRPEWKRHLKEAYGIEIGGRVISCVRGGYIESYDRAYNAVQREEIIRRFGRDVVMEEGKRIRSERKASASSR